jgi:hypothetical protein
MDKVQKPNISESYTPSSESYTNYLTDPWSTSNQQADRREGNGKL